MLDDAPRGAARPRTAPGTWSACSCDQPVADATPSPPRRSGWPSCGARPPAGCGCRCRRGPGRRTGRPSARRRRPPAASGWSRAFSQPRSPPDSAEGPRETCLASSAKSSPFRSRCRIVVPVVLDALHLGGGGVVGERQVDVPDVELLLALELLGVRAVVVLELLIVDLDPAAHLVLEDGEVLQLVLDLVAEGLAGQSLGHQGLVQLGVIEAVLALDGLDLGVDLGLGDLEVRASSPAGRRAARDTSESRAARSATSRARSRSGPGGRRSASREHRAAAALQLAEGDDVAVHDGGHPVEGGAQDGGRRGGRRGGRADGSHEQEGSEQVHGVTEAMAFSSRVIWACWRSAGHVLGLGPGALLAQELLVDVRRRLLQRAPLRRPALRHLEDVEAVGRGGDVRDRVRRKREADVEDLREPGAACPISPRSPPSRPSGPMDDFLATSAKLLRVLAGACREAASPRRGCATTICSAWTDSAPRTPAGARRSSAPPRPGSPGAAGRPRSRRAAPAPAAPGGAP